MSSSEKIINFTNFKSKQINTIIAGKIQKGSCNDGVYSFSFINSKIINNFEGEFILELSQPKNQIILKLKILDSDIGQKIYFLDNYEDYLYEHPSKHLKELNKNIFF